LEIEQVKVHQVSLPFSIEFAHSLRKRSSVNNIVVEVIADKGRIRGYGEGAPRSYVTGESQESVSKAIRMFTEDNSFPWKLVDDSQIWDFVDGLPYTKKHNSAVCALEMSLLDALGKSQGKPMIEYFPKDFATNTVYYGASIPLSDKEGVIEVCQLIKKMGISKLRLKMGQDFEQNKGAIETVKVMFGDDYDLRIDINGAWDRELALKHLPLIKDYKVKVIEQPMMPGARDIAEFAEAIQNYSAVLMADESACSLREIERIIKEGYYKMVNVRLSKCGGFRNALKIIDHLRQKGIPFQIGCQLGESGLLSAAGRVLCLLCRDAAYYDGSYDGFILKENITVENVCFGPRGEAGPLGGSGLGVVVSSQSLKRLSTESITVKG
jgi:muconate cycloisomerase